MKGKLNEALSAYHSRLACGMQRESEKNKNKLYKAEDLLVLELQILFYTYYSTSIRLNGVMPTYIKYLTEYGNISVRRSISSVAAYRRLIKGSRVISQI